MKIYRFVFLDVNGEVDSDLSEAQIVDRINNFKNSEINGSEFRIGFDRYKMIIPASILIGEIKPKMNSKAVVFRLLNSIKEIFFWSYFALAVVFIIPAIYYHQLGLFLAAIFSLVPLIFGGLRNLIAVNKFRSTISK